MNTKRLFYHVSILATALAANSAGLYAQYSRGDGSAASPWEISSSEGLVALAIKVNNGMDYSGKYFILTNNIELTEPWVPIGGVGLQPASFSGNFNGKGHVIKNLSFSSDANNYVACALFGKTSRASITNVRMVNVNIAAISSIAAALAGECESTIIINCGSSGEVSSVSGTAGGLVGVLSGSNSHLYNSYSTCNVSNTCNYPVGGLLGWLKNGATIENCYTMGDVATQSGPIGGLVGQSDVYPGMTNCYWNSSAIQIFNEISRGVSEKKGLGSGEQDLSVNGRNWDFMNGDTPDHYNRNFVEDYLNANLKESPNAAGWVEWQKDTCSCNNGYPIHIREAQAAIPVKKFILTFNTTGGSAVDTITADSASVIYLSDKITIKEKHIFEGWHDSPSYSNNALNTVTLVRNTTLYAKWKPRHYTLTYHTNGGTTIAPITSILPNTLITLNTNTIRTDFLFDGWYTNSALIENKVQAVMVVRDTAVYAKWRAKTYRLKFVTAPGNAIPDKTGIAYNEEVILKSFTPTALNCVFSGWYADYGYRNGPLEKITLISDTAVYSKWLIERVITWDQEIDDGCQLTNNKIKLTAFSTDLSENNLPITYESSNQNIAVVEGDELIIVGGGKVAITAKQDGIPGQGIAPAVLERIFNFKIPANQVLLHWDDMLVLNNSAKRYADFQWYRNGQAIPGATAQYYCDNSVKAPGTFHVSVNGGITRTCDLVTMGATQVNAPASAMFAYPNPVGAGEMITVELNVPQELLYDAVIKVIDLQGNVAKTVKTLKQTMQINMPQNQGQYMIVLYSSGKEAAVLKILVK